MGGGSVTAELGSALSSVVSTIGLVCSISASGSASVVPGVGVGWGGEPGGVGVGAGWLGGAELDGAPGGSGRASCCFGSRPALISPIPTKKSSTENE